MRKMILSAAACLLLLAGVTSARLAGESTVARRALDTTLPEINLVGISMADALEFVRDVSGANVHVNWPALEATGIDKTTLVNVRLRNVTLRKTLDLILSESGAGAPLTFYVDDGVIEITTRELADQLLVTRVYPIEDLIVEIPDFTDAPQFNLDQNAGGGSGGGGSGGGGGGGGGGSGSIFGGGGGGGSGQGGQDTGTSRAERADALIKVITDVIYPDIWQINGGNASIRFFNGSLVVTAPRSVHESLGGPFD